MVQISKKPSDGGVVVKDSRGGVRQTYKCWSKTCIFKGMVVIILCHYVAFNSWLKGFQNPLPVEECNIIQQLEVFHTETYTLRESRQSKLHRKVHDLDADKGVRLAAFDDELPPLSNITLSRTWNLLPTDQGVSVNMVDANTCFFGTIPLKKKNRVKCLPSLLILGFEKCRTSALNIWLAHHPNLVSRYLEGRFFDNLESIDQLEAQWLTYLHRQPSIPKSKVGQYWTLEKSPAYVTSPHAPEMVAALLPHVRLLILTRNPTERAYSMFCMCTRLYVDVSTVLKRQPLSFFAKHKDSGDVVYLQKPGIGGQVVLNGTVSTSNHSDEWRYLSYPPDPRDFDTWIRQELLQKTREPDLTDRTRSHRILFGGLFSFYLQQWLAYFPPERFVIIPSEIFFTNTASESLNKLQRLLGLPVFDYSSILKLDDSGRMDVDSVASTMNSYINSNGKVPPMMASTRELLDEFYCESNRKLSRLLGGRSLPGYSCTETPNN